MPDTLPDFPVDDMTLDSIEHALGGCLNENMDLIGADYSLWDLLQFLSGYDQAKVEVLERHENGSPSVTEYVGGCVYHPNDVIRALIAEVRRLRGVHMCIHSAMEPECIGCWERVARHSQTYIGRMRVVLDAAVGPHEFVGGTGRPSDECEVCLIFRDRHGGDDTHTERNE